MVSKKDFDDGLEKLKTELRQIIDKSISDMREHVIEKHRCK